MLDACYSVGPSKKLWTPDERKGVWKHDMWEQLQKEEAASRTTAYNWNRGRSGELYSGRSVCLRCLEKARQNPLSFHPFLQVERLLEARLAFCGAARRGRYNGYGRGGRGDNWVPRNFRGGRYCNMLPLFIQFLLSSLLGPPC